MRIAVLSSYPDKKCGLADYTYPLVQEFKKSKDIEKVIVIGDMESTKADYIVDFKSINLYKKVREIITRESIDLLYICHEYWIYGKTNLGFIIVHYKVDAPVVTLLSVITSTDPGVSLAERIRARLVERLVSRKAKKIVVNSGINMEQLTNFPKEKIVEIPLGLSAKIKREVTNKKNVKTILFFGVISPHKGVKNIIKATEHLKNIRLIIAGKPNIDVKRLLILRNEQSGRNEIIFNFNWISSDKKEEYFSCADVVVLPYTRIGLQSGVLHDALSYGVPCVVSAGGMMGSIVSKYQVGEVVNPLDPVDIARGIEEVLNDFDRYQNNIFEYRKIASWENVAKMYIELFKRTYNEAAT